MKKWKAFLIAVVCVLVILFFPVVSTQSVTGNAAVITEAGPRPGTSPMEIQIRELRSLACTYRKNFAITLEGNRVDEFASSYASESEYGDCVISQMYYDEELDRMTLCTLFHPHDEAYIEITWKENRYILEIEK